MRKILIVVDMQNDFIDGSLGTEDAKAIVPRVCQKLKNEVDKTLILFTQDTHPENYLDTAEGKKLPVVHCVKNTEGWEINKEVMEAYKSNPNRIQMGGGNSVLKGTFGSVHLARVIEDWIKFFKQNPNLKNNEPLEEIELIGLCTDICVVSNALLLKAYFPDIKITVDASCCAGVTSKLHNEALNVMNSCQIDVINRG